MLCHWPRPLDVALSGAICEPIASPADATGVVSLVRPLLLSGEQQYRATLVITGRDSTGVERWLAPLPSARARRDSDAVYRRFTLDRFSV